MQPLRARDTPLRCPTGATRSRDDVSREADALLRVDIDSLTEDEEDNMISESLRIIHELYAAIAAEAPSTSAHEVVSREPPMSLAAEAC